MSVALGLVEREAIDQDESNQIHWQSLFIKHGISVSVPQGITVLPTFVRQKDTWDCGIACLQMILHLLEETSFSSKTSPVVPSYESIMTTMATQSIWTIDLVWYLYQYTSSFSPIPSVWFITQSLRPNPNWKELTYYQSAYTNDCHRIVQRLHELQSSCPSNTASTAVTTQVQQQALPLLQQVKTSFSIHMVRELVQRQDCIAIALIDHTVLAQNSPSLLSFSFTHEQSSYAGHYIILAGIQSEPNHDTDVFVVYNPAKDEAPIYLSITTFEQAWRSKGTDEDIIFIFLS